MNKKLLTLSTAAVAASIALSGCAAGTGSEPAPGMHHGSTGAMSSPAPDASAGHNAADGLSRR